MSIQRASVVDVVRECMAAASAIRDARGRLYFAQPENQFSYSSNTERFHVGAGLKEYYESEGSHGRVSTRSANTTRGQRLEGIREQMAALARELEEFALEPVPIPNPT